MGKSRIIQSLSRANAVQLVKAKNKEDIVYHVPLVNIAKKILGKVEPEQKELVSVSKNLSNMIKTRLGLKIIQGTGGRRLVEVPEAYLKTVTTLTTVTKPKSRIVKLG